MRLLIALCIGVAVTLAWQSYGDAAREMIANSSPQLSWLALQTAVAQTAPDTIVPTTPSPDPQEIKAISVDLAALRQRVDQLAAQVAAGQEQMTRDFTTKLKSHSSCTSARSAARPLAGRNRPPPRRRCSWRRRVDP